MTFPLNNLTDAIANVCPIDGVSIGNESNRASWRIDFKAAATAEQRAAAATVLASFDAEAPPEPDPQAPVLDLKAYAAAKRYVIESGGIVFNAKAIATDRDSQARICATVSYLEQNPSLGVEWKTADGGFLTLNRVAMLALADAVGSRVQACRAKEAEVAAAIDGLTITTTAEIDVAFAEITP